MKTFIHQKSMGFTLIELMVAITIVAILAMIAIPAYSGQIRKTARGDTIAEVLKIAQKLEHIRGKTFVYPSGKEDDFKFESDRYSITAAIPDGASFSITAGPKGDQVKDICGELQYSSEGNWSFGNGRTSTDCL